MSIITQRAANQVRRGQQAQEMKKAQVDDAVGRVHTVSGEFVMDGTGEVILDVNFPITFIEKPKLAFGGELAPDAVITAGAFPTVSCVVGRWYYIERPNQPFYKGAALIAVTSGPEGQKMVIHWQMTGRAITNPVSDGDTADSTI